MGVFAERTLIEYKSTKKETMKKLLLILSFVLTFFIPLGSYAQPPAFTLSITTTPQTCLGNGSLNFTVTGNDPLATMSYAVFLLPNTTTAVTTVTVPTATNLTAGNYQVVATQTLSGQSNTSTANATIVNQAVTLAYSLEPVKIRCGNDGKIIVNVTAGSAVSYEIISGPQLRPQQATNTFTGLPVGNYEVRVYDACGDALVVSVELIQATTGVIIDFPQISQGELPTCNTIIVSHSFRAVSPNEIFYPLTFQYTVFPPGGGAATVVSQNVVSGNTTDATIPFYNDQQYTYDLKVTDVCGNVFVLNNNIVNEKLLMNTKYLTESCGNYFFTLTPLTYKGPYTINFINAPAGFNPAMFNSEHPTSSLPELQYGDNGNPVPIGTYEIEITDACGHTFIQEMTIMDEDEVLILASSDPTTCLGQVGITLKSGRSITAVVVTAAPASYANTLPDDVSEFIIGEAFLMGNIPLGEYTFEVTSECGVTYTITGNILSSGQVLLTKTQRPGCALGEGSLKMGSSGNRLAEVIITAAPGTFTEQLPFDASANIYATDGVFYMNSLPEGDYTFQTIDNCGTERIEQVTIQGYAITKNDVVIIPKCGSFNIDLQFASNGVYVQSFWLQQLNEVTGVWFNPFSGLPYTDGEFPTNDDSYFLNNNQININLGFTGEFRILRIFHSYGNGDNKNNRCFEVINSFTFDGAPTIHGAYSFPCVDGLSEVIIDATGVAPLTYEITSKNNAPFSVDNGESNLFSGLEAATYNFRVTDDCNSFKNILLDITALEPIKIEPFGFCENEESSLVVSSFSFLTYSWWKAGAPGTILSTTNSLTFPSFESDTDTGTYFVSIESSDQGSCINQVLEYVVTPNVLPNAGNDNAVVVCNKGDDIDITAYLSTPHDNGGTWTDVNATGHLAGSILSTEELVPGSYEFIYLVTSECGTEDEATITIELKDVPQTPTIDPIAPICEGGDIQLSTATIATATYQWTGPNGFTSSLQNPVIEDATVAASGTYTLMVTVNECASAPVTVQVIVDAAANAGEDDAIPLCNDGNAIDLADYLSTPHDAAGVWEDVNVTGALSGSMFEPEGITAGVYQFKYIVTNACNIEDEAIITITLKDIPQTQVIEPTLPVCEGNDIQLSTTAVTDAVYQWTGPNGFTSSVQNPLIENATVTDSGTYTLTVTVNECASEEVTVEVIVSAAANAGENATIPLCNDGSTIDLADYLSTPHDAGGIWEDVNATGGLSGSMFDPEGITAGAYQFKYVVTNACNMVDEAIITIQLNDIPGAPSIAAISPICEGNDIQLSTTAITNAVYQWTGPNGFTSSVQNPLIESAVITASGTYSLLVTVNGCASPTVTVVVVVNELPQFVMEGNTLLCDGQSSTLSVVPGNFNTNEVVYEWYLDNTLLTDVTESDIEIFETGTYKVNVNKDGCISTQEINVTLNTNAFEIEIDNGCVDYKYILSIVNINEMDAAEVSWTGPNGYSYIGKEADITKLVGGEYSVVVTNSDGCTATAVVPVDNTFCDIPRGISPNGDGMNDSFDLSNFDVSEIKIFNRYGLNIYEAKNYKNEWHGQASGGEAPTGTYYYAITFSGGAQITGWVYVQREIK
ncbi:hypothetical protein D3C87_188430 [compost metagenome]